MAGQLAGMAGEVSFVLSHGALGDALIARQDEGLAAAQAGRWTAHAGNARVVTRLACPALVVIPWRAGTNTLELLVQYFIVVCTSEAPQAIFARTALGWANLTSFEDSKRAEGSQ